VSRLWEAKRARGWCLFPVDLLCFGCCGCVCVTRVIRVSSVTKKKTIGGSVHARRRRVCWRDLELQMAKRGAQHHHRSIGHSHADRPRARAPGAGRGRDAPFASGNVVFSTLVPSQSQRTRGTPRPTSRPGPGRVGTTHMPLRSFVRRTRSTPHVFVHAS